MSLLIINIWTVEILYFRNDFSLSPLKNKKNSISCFKYSSSITIHQLILIISICRCDCGNCTTMPTNIECICCCEVGPIDAILSENDMECVTHHEGFQGNCLNRYVIQVSLLDYVQMEGPIDDNNFS